MAMGRPGLSGGMAPTAEINMTPLVDVMLVLLIIFIITAPLMTHSVALELPRASSQPTQEKPTTLTVSITADNAVFVASEAIDRNELEQKFRAAVAQNAAVEIRLHADRATRYETVAETLSAAQRAGLTKIGFVTEPSSTPR